MAQPMARGRNFVLTVNNYTDDMKEALENMPMQYGIIGAEVGRNGTCHLQAYVQLKTQHTLTAFQKKIQALGIKAWAHIANGSPEKNFDYCSKDKEYTEIGTMKSAGKRTDYHSIHDKIQAGVAMKAIREEFPAQWYHSHRAMALHEKEVKKEIYEAKLKEEMEHVVLREWQKDILERIHNQTDRQVLWVVDTVGNTGKSFLSKYLHATQNAFEIANGKSGDIAFAYNLEKIVVFDLSRQKEGFMNYSIIEDFKNGRLFSSKYESNVMRFDPPKVVIFANWYPQFKELSQDRWDMFIMGEVRSDVMIVQQAPLVHGFVFND